jgi:hypothetical protein
VVAVTEARDLDTGLAAEIAKPVLRPFVAIHIDFPDPVFAFTGKGSFDHNGATWLGIEGVATISAIEEGIEGSAKGFRATLFKVPEEYQGDIVDQAVRGCLYEVFLGVFAPDWQSIVGWHRMFKGTLQGFEIDFDDSNMTVTATGETRNINQRRPAIKTYTDEYQQRKYPGDRVFEYAARMAEVPVLWAKAKQDAL